MISNNKQLQVQNMEAIVQAGIRKSRGIMLKKGQLALSISRNSFSQACLRDLLGLHKSVTPLAVAYSVLHCICLSALASTSPPTLIYFLSVGGKHCDFFFSFSGVLQILLSASAILEQNSHIPIPRSARLTIWCFCKLVWVKSVQCCVAGLYQCVSGREEGMYLTSCHLLASALQFRAQSPTSLDKNFGLVLYCGLVLCHNHGGMISRSTRCTAGC